ncbi:MAG: helix-hairpin-helix domain-containing protein [Bacteroidales bacterium]|nr:helix-hairpin-helix domain-containing protein [Candidatus Cacconaster merdequi]
MRREKKKSLSEGASDGIVALVFLVLGFQLALFVTKVVRRPSLEDAGLQTVVSEEGGLEAVADSGTCTIPENKPLQSGSTKTVGRYSYEKSCYGGYSRKKVESKPESNRKTRCCESFSFDPNTVTTEDLVRLGLSPRQAEVIDNYRQKGGKFRRKTDFAKMYVVSDTLFQRLEPFISIPRTELNAADSAALVALPGIGPWFAARIIEYRGRLGGFVSIEQLLEIEGFDEERYHALEEYVTVDSTLVEKFDVWTATEERLSLHPYVGERTSHAISRFKSVYDTSLWSLEKLVDEHILTSEMMTELKKYLSLQVKSY